jgi:tellurite resistance protein
MQTTLQAGITPRDPAAVAPVSIQHLPINLFGAVMGLAGLSLAWRLAEPVFGAPHWIGELSGLLALLAFVAQATGYAAKLLLHRAAVRRDFDDPVTGNFFGQISISLLLLSAVLMPYGSCFAEAVWSLGVVITFMLSLVAVGRMLKGKLDPAHMLPVWLIPGVATLDIGVTGGHMPMPWAHEVVLFALAIGSMLALVLWTLIISRLVYGEPLPARMKPQLMILVAPFAVGFLAWVNVFGEVDRFAGVLFYFGLFMLAVVGPRIYRRDVPFTVGWWAIGFPLAALANAAIVYANARGGWLLHVIAGLLLALLTLSLAVLGLRTLYLVFSGKLFRA